MEGKKEEGREGSRKRRDGGEEVRGREGGGGKEGKRGEIYEKVFE